MNKQMSQLSKWQMVMLMILLILISSACGTPASLPSTDMEVVVTATPESGAASVETNVDFGTGPVSFPDTQAGLTDLSSYTATLTLTFTGTEAGQSNPWTKTYVMLAAKEPAVRQLTIETTGANAGRVFMAEMNGAAYERRGENDCIASAIEEGASRTERLEPAGFLNGVIGAEEAGVQTVEAVAANHYTFNESAFGQSGIAAATGEMWVASEGGYVLKYLLTTKGNADYFGEGIEGTLTWDYQLTNINQAVMFTLPDDCPAGMVNAPLPPDASSILNMPGLLTYDTSTSLADITAFYQQELPSLGWAPTGEPSMTDTTVFLDFIQGDETMAVIANIGDDGTTVDVMLGSSQK